MSDNLDELAEKLKEKREDLQKDITEKCASVFGTQRNRFVQMIDRCRVLQSRFDELKARAKALSVSLELLPAWSQRISEVAGRFEATAAQCTELTDQLKTAVGAQSANLEAAVNNSLSATEAAISDQCQAVGERLAESTGAMGDGLEKVTERLGGIRRETWGKIQPRVGGSLLAQIRRDAEPFIAGAKSLRETGISEIHEVADKVQKIRDRIQRLMENKHKIQPVLDVVRRFL